MKLVLDGAPVFVGRGGVERGGVERDGDPAGDPADARPALVLLHGAGMDRTVWVLLARYFARHGFDVVAPDFPGHGGSGGAPLPSVEALADWTHALLETLAAEHGIATGEVALAGHSLGALVALEGAARHERVTRLLLLGAAYPMPVGDALLGAAARDERAAIDMITIFGHGYASRLGHNTVPGISVTRLAGALLARAGPGVLHADLQACHRYEGGERAADTLSSSGVAVHLVAGDEDRMTPMSGTRALATLLGTGIESIPGSGHMMMTEQPELVLRAMRRALD